MLERLPEPALLVRNGRIFSANAAARDLFGPGAGGLLGRSPLTLLHSDPGSEAPRRSGRAARRRAGAWRATAQRVVRTDGQTRFVDTAAATIADHGPAMQVLVMHDVTDKHLLQRELLRSQSALRRLTVGRDRAHESARRRFAHELHDELMQSLAAIRMQLDDIGAQLEPPQQDIKKRLDSLAGVTLSAMDATRRIVNELRPPMLEELGLRAALEMLLSDFTRRTGTPCSLHADGMDDETASPPLTTICLYRVLEECLADIDLHARATRIDVTLTRKPDVGLLLAIHDDGPGFDIDPAGDAAVVGLIGVEERLRALGGTLTVDVAEGGGKTIEAVVPRALPPDPARPVAELAATNRHPSRRG